MLLWMAFTPKQGTCSVAPLLCGVQAVQSVSPYTLPHQTGVWTNQLGSSRYMPNNMTLPAPRGTPMLPWSIKSIHRVVVVRELSTSAHTKGQSRT